MKERIYTKVIKGKPYYYLQSSYRIKIDPDNDGGNTKGSGKSKVLTNTTYLGTAASIKKKLLTIREPTQVKSTHFGFVAAIYKTAEDAGLIELLKKNIKGKRYGIENWKYFLLAIINRLQQATSKEKMGDWSATTVLPELMGFDPKKMNSKSFWYATKDVIDESALQKARRNNKRQENDIFAQTNTEIFRHIERSLVKDIIDKYNITSDLVLYDTTNFYTFFSQKNNSKLSRAGHNKEGRHNLRQVGLAMFVEQEFGIPLYHCVYAGNSHDSKTFYQAISQILFTLKQSLQLSKDIVLIIDKGNSSKDNFDKLKGQLEFIGSLSIYDYNDLADKPLKEYTESFESKRYYSLLRKIHGQEFRLILTYDEKLYRKNRHSFYNGIEKFKTKVRQKWIEYKRPFTRVPKGVKTMLNKSRYKKYLKIKYRKGEAVFEYVTNEIEEREKHWGKHILFSSRPETTAEKIIHLYGSKDKVEKGFGILKSPDLVRWIPMRHGTDSKIRAFAFCCVMSLIIIRIMELKLERADLKMSPNVIKQELMDLQKIIMIYDEKTAISKITSKSTVQKRMCEIFDLGPLEHELTIQ
ncbi:MAG: IS1634 family transposase [Bacteroidetes bacterium]|nr:IS1634 family transposase [Bacteroidota bacterium]